MENVSNLWFLHSVHILSSCTLVVYIISIFIIKIRGRYENYKRYSQNPHFRNLRTQNLLLFNDHTLLKTSGVEQSRMFFYIPLFM